MKGNLRWRPQSFKDTLQVALNKLKDENKIGFNKKICLWKLKNKADKVKLHPLSDEEKVYFEREGLGEGWFRLRDGKTGAMLSSGCTKIIHGKSLKPSAATCSKTAA